MNTTPPELKYTQTHEWVRREAEGDLTIGITEHAQEQLGDLVYVELPEVGAVLNAEAECMAVESVKAASDIYAPMDGEVVEVNTLLADQPELINQEPYGQGWLFRLRPSDAGAVDRLLSAQDYADLLSA